MVRLDKNYHRLTTVFPSVYVFAGILTLLVCAFAIFPIEAEDIFSNIVSGRYVWEHKTIPSVDPFSYTGPFPWFFDRVLSSLYYFFIHELFGIFGIIVSTALILAAGCVLGFVFLYRRHQSPLLPFLMVLVSIPASSYWYLPRSYTFGYLCVHVYMIVLLSDKRNWIWFLLPLQVVWTNMHSSSVLGIGMAGLYWLFISKKKLTSLLFPVSTVLVNVLSPVGIKFFSNLWNELFGQHASRMNIYEWFSPFHPMIIHQPLTLWFIGGLCLFASVSLLLILKIVKVKHTWFLLGVTGVLCMLSIQSARHIPIFYISLLYLVGLSTVSWSYALQKQVITKSSLIAVFVSLGLVIYLFFHGYSNGVNTRRFGVGIVPSKFPNQAFLYLKQFHLSGNIFNEYGYGAYFLYTMYPEYKVYIDGGRLDQVYGESFYQHYLKMGTDKETILHDIQTYDIQAFLLPFPSTKDDVVEVYRYLSQDPAWKLMYFNDYVLVFVSASVAVEKNIPVYSYLNPLYDIGAIAKQSPEIQDGLEQDFQRAETINPDSFVLRAARIAYLDAIGQPRAVHTLLGDLEHYCNTRDSSRYCYIRLVRQLLLYGQIQRAMQYKEKIVDWFIPDFSSLELLADVDVAEGNFSSAIQLYQKALTLTRDPEATASITKKIYDTKTQQSSFVP